LRPWRLVELNQVAAGVGANGDRNRALTGRLLREHDAECLQAPILPVNFVDLERGGRNALLEQTFLKGLADRIGVGFQD
jgi:hypothetical protein